MTSHSDHLVHRHRKIDEEIRIEQKSLARDDIRLLKMKKRKLAMKDRLRGRAARDDAMRG